MSLTEEFNDDYEAEKENDFVLSVSYSVKGYTTVLAYDFMARVMTLRTPDHGDGGAVVVPFSQLDREVLVKMRDKLLDLEGHPPELPAEAPSNPGNTRSLRP